MRNYFFAITAILFLSQGVYSQEQSVLDGVYLKSDKEQISDIDKITQKIKANLKRYTKTEELKDNTGYRYVYKKGKELRQIKVLYKDNNIDKRVVWYFNNGQLIYSEQTWKDRDMKKVVDNEKFYFNNERLFAWFKFDKEVDFTTEEFKKVADELSAYASKLKAENSK